MQQLLLLRAPLPIQIPVGSRRSKQGILLLTVIVKIKAGRRADNHMVIVYVGLGFYSFLFIVCGLQVEKGRLLFYLFVFDSVLYFIDKGRFQFAPEFY